MGIVQKTVFISYRRTNLPWALNIYQHLTQHGYDVFFDYQSIDSGDFEKIILDNIKARAHFLIVLTPSALDRCNESGDWLRQEIETALETGRNIIPLMMEGFDFGSPNVQKALTGKLETLSKINGLPLYSAYFFEGMERLQTRFLNKALEDIPTIDLEADAKEVTKRLIEVANNLPPVEKEELTAQEWFERGYKSQQEENYKEAIRCYSEYLHIEPKDNFALSNLGIVFAKLAIYDKAEDVFRKAIKIDPSDTIAYNNLGNLLKILERNDKAEEAYRKAIKLNPKETIAYYNLGNLLLTLERYGEAEEAYRKAVKLNPDDRDIHILLFGLFRKMGRWEEAEEQMKRIQELDQ